MKPTRLAFALFALLPLAADDPGRDARATAAAARLTGVWAARSLVVDGRRVPQDHMTGALMVAFVGSNYYQRVGERITEEGTFTVDPAASPAAIDLMAETGGDPGVKQLGVYRLAGDELVLSLARPGAKARPRGLDGASGSGVVAVLRRYRP